MRYFLAQNLHIFENSGKHRKTGISDFEAISEISHEYPISSQFSQKLSNSPKSENMEKYGKLGKIAIFAKFVKNQKWRKLWKTPKN